MVRQFWYLFLELSLSGVDQKAAWKPWKDFQGAFEDSRVMATAFKIYSLETPIYTQINKSSTDMDQEQLDALAPYAWYLSFLCHT